MELTVESIKLNFQRFNAEFFENKLPTPQFEIIRTTKMLGHCQMTRRTAFSQTTYKIGITKAFKLSSYSLKCVLLHEMIHLYLYVKYPTKNMKHNSFFMAKAKEISEKSGFEITEYADISSERMFETKKCEFIFFNNKEKNITQVIRAQNDNYVSDIINFLQKRSNAFSEIRHKTIVTDDAYILGLKKSRTIMHSYNVSNKLKEKFEKYLV